MYRHMYIAYVYGISTTDNAPAVRGLRILCMETIMGILLFGGIWGPWGNSGGLWGVSEGASGVLWGSSGGF